MRIMQMKPNGTINRYTCELTDFLNNSTNRNGHYIYIDDHALEFDYFKIFYPNHFIGRISTNQEKIITDIQIDELDSDYIDSIDDLTAELNKRFVGTKIQGQLQRKRISKNNKDLRPSFKKQYCVIVAKHDGVLKYVSKNFPNLFLYTVKLEDARSFLDVYAASNFIKQFKDSKYEIEEPQIISVQQTNKICSAELTQDI